ncbi:hypothetical protein BMS3Bbin01_01257 [bacterium BMS3Bbin01]|nr:hypothetical protein BMS3Bbin01_01257 [bacterium BMS3Bbin01]
MSSPVIVICFPSKAAGLSISVAPLTVSEAARAGDAASIRSMTMSTRENVRIIFPSPATMQTR